MTVTVLSKEITVVSTYLLIIVAGILNIVYAYDDFEIMVAIEPAV